MTLQPNCSRNKCKNSFTISILIFIFFPAHLCAHTMRTIAVLLVLPALICAKIEVEITASDDQSQRQVVISGSNVDLISDQERETFKLSDENLKSALKSYFGEKPDDVYLRSPTPWGDLYLTNEWKQVTRTLKPLKAQILTVKYQPSLVTSKVFNYTSSKPGHFKALIRQDVENTVASTWERSGELSANSNIEYGIDIKAMAVSGKATFSYNSRWGEDVLKSQKVTVGSEAAVDVTLNPNQTVTAELYATRGSMKVQIDYEATLSGSVAVNYGNLYKDHHFWSVDINKVMAAGGWNRSILSSEVIDLGFYADSKAVLRDSDTNEVLYTMPLTVF